MGSLLSGLSAVDFWDSWIGGTPRRMAIANGYNRSLSVDGIAAYEMGIDAPPAAPTSNTQIDGSLSAGDYLYKFVYRRSVHGIIGNGSTASAAITAGANPNDGLRINIPANTALQAGIDFVRVYRTLVDGSSFFFDGEKAYSGSAITYDSTIADSALGALLSDDNGIPDSRPFGLEWKDQWHEWGSLTYKTGTVAPTNGSANVTGTNTVFTKAMVGREFKVAGDSQTYTILTFTSTTAIVLDEVYAGTGGGGQSYTISLNPLFTRWSNIDSTANALRESFPAANVETFSGGRNNEKAAGLGHTGDYKILLSNYSAYGQAWVSANVYRKVKVRSATGCGNFRTIINDNQDNLYYMSPDGQIQRIDNALNTNIMSEYVRPILDGTHVGTHRNLRQDLSDIDKAHFLYYPARNWLMFFFVMGTTATYPNACLIMDLNINPSGSFALPSPWMLWTGFTAVSSTLRKNSDSILIPHIGDDLGFEWKMDSGTNDGVPSGTNTGTVTGANATTLTDSTASFYTTGDGLKGVHIRTYNATTGALENDIVLASNNGTVLTVAAWTTTPAVGDTYWVGGIEDQRYTNLIHEGVPDLTKKTADFYLTCVKASSSRNLNIKSFVNGSSTPELAAGQDIDVSVKKHNLLGIKMRGHEYQYLMESHGTDLPITVLDFGISSKIGGKK